MRKSFTQLLGFFLLSVMMLFSSGLYAQETQSTVELIAGSVDKCYNKTNSYTSTISVKDFIKMKSFKLTLNFDKSEFEFDAVANANALLLSGVTATVIPDPVLGIVQFTWTNTTEVTIGNNVVGGVPLFDAKFKVVNFPNNVGDNLFDSPLAWDVVNSTFYYVSDWGVGGSYQVETTRFTSGTMNVPVNYTEIAYTVTPASCAGSNATITITSPTAVGMKYYFNGSATASTTGIADALAPSVNTVRIEDASGCYSHLFTIPVTAPSPLTINSVTTENPLCFGGQGEIQFGISGGTAPYTYWVVPAADWTATVDNDLNTKPVTDPVFSNYKFVNFQVLKPAGTYYVAVNDANGCIDLRDNTKWQTVTITPVTAQITYTATPVNNTCNGYTDGSITVTNVAGGTGTNYEVSIDGIHWFAIVGGTGSYTFPTLAAKAYTVSVRDINLCTITKNVTVTQPGAIAFTTAYTDASCSGGTTGTISIPTATGGTGAYQFVVAIAGTPMPATGWVAAAPGTISGLAANYYSVWVKDASGCVQPFANQDGSGNILPIQAPGQLSFTTNAEVLNFVDVTCYNGDFTLAVTAAGGVAPYTYSFDGAAYSSTSTLALTALVADRVVAVAVMDANGCISNRSVTVNVPTLLDIFSFTNPLSPTCSGGTDGRITVNAVGGIAPYMYSTNNTTWFANNVLALPEGPTTVYVKDAKGCVTSDIVNVAFLTPSAFVAAPTGLIACNGNTTTEGVAITGLTWAAGRTIQYFVSNSAATVFTSGSVFVPASVNGVAADDGNALTLIDYKTFGAGTYYVGARDEYGCVSAVKEVKFLENAALQLASVTITNTTCSGSFDGSITINTLGGNGTPLYAIVNNPIAISNLVAGDFQVVEDYNITTEGIKIGKQVVQALRGTYYVVLRDVCITDNSIFAGPFIVDGYKPIALDEVAHPVVKTNITCNNANDGTITVSGVTGGKPEFDGTGLYTYKLYKDNVLVVTTTPNTTGVFTGLAAGVYYVTITDATDCPLYKTSSVTVVNPTVLTITNVAVTHFTCVTSNNGIVAITAAGGTGAYWLAVNASVNGLGTDIKASDWIAFPASSTTKPYIATEPGLYKFYVKDANGCLAAPVTATVLAPKVLTPVVAVNTPVSCVSGNDGSVDINATGGFETTTPAFTHTYLFSLKSDFTAPVNTDGIFAGLTAGTYTVYVKATNTPAYSNGGIVSYTYPMVACSYQLTFDVAEPVAYSYQGLVTKRVSCRGGNDGELKVTVIGGGTPFVDLITGQEYDVQLTTTASPVLLPGSWKRTTGKVATFSNLPHAIYSVWIKDSKGCLLPTGPEVLPTPVPENYEWHKVASWEVQQPGTVLTVSATWNNDVTCFGGNDGKFTVTALGGTPPYRFAAKKSVLPLHVFAPDPNSAEWLTNLGVFDSAEAATWIVWAMDANGCIVGGEGTGTPVDEWRVQVRQPVQVDFALTAADAKCFGGATGTITASSILSDPNVTYRLSAAGAPYSITVVGTDAAGNAVNITRTALAFDNVVAINIPASETKHVEPVIPHVHNAYTVTVTDKNGCFNSHSVVVWQNPELDVQIVKADGAFLCPGDNNGVIEAVATGGTNWNNTAPGSYSYQLTRDGVVYTAWQSIPSFIVEVGHTWKVEVKDGNGCIDSDEEILNTPVGVTTTLHETTCYGDATASVIIKATGEAGRTFSIRYRRNTTPTFGAWVAFTSEIAINNLIFANSIEEQNFYYFEVKDDKGCTTEFHQSFVATQHPLEVTVVQAEDQLSASMTLTGGISPYTYVIGDATVKLPVDGNTFQVVELKAPATVVTVYDAHGCMVAKSLEVAPLTVAAVPESGNNMDVTFDVVLTFNRDVTPAEGITVTGGTAVITGTTGKVFTVAITAEDLADVKIILANTIKDAGNNMLEATTFTYKVGDHVAPTLVVTPPDAPVANVFTVGLKFSEPVSGVLGGVTVTGGTLTTVSGLGDEYTLTVSALEQTLVTIVLSDAIKDLSLNMNPFAGETLTYTTGDFTAPQLVTWTPTDGETITDNHPLLKMTFNENVVVGDGGNLKVYKVATTTAILDIPITAAMISGKDVTVTYTTANGLDKNTRYYVLVDGLAIEDNAGNKFAGVSDVSAWTFKTGDHFLVGIDPLVNGSLFKVYPNPFVDFVNIDFSSKLSKVVVTNIAGQVVKQVVNPANRIQLNELRSGIYFISLYTSDNVIAKTAKIVKR